MNPKMREIIDRKRKLRIVGKYNIKFLDDFLLGILEEDFVLIGSSTGMGKSELAYDISFHNATQKKKVHLFALEADRDEPYLRRLYKKAAQIYYKDLEENPEMQKRKMGYRNFVTNKINIEEYEEEAGEEIGSVIDEYLFVHYREGEFNINTLIKEMKAIENNCDIMVLDHVDYFDMDDTRSENMQMSEIMKHLRNINQVYRIPIIVISHLRKKGNAEQIIPSIDDFFGSSNKAKQVKTVITIGRNHGEDDYENMLYKTYFNVPKSRIGGGCMLAGQMTFDGKTNTYLDIYRLFRVKSFGTSLEEIKQAPDWYNGGFVYEQIIDKEM